MAQGSKTARPQGGDARELALPGVLEAATRLSLLGAVLELGDDRVRAAALAAVAASLTAARAWVRAERAASALTRTFDRAVRALRALDVRALAARREDEQGVATLLDAIRESAMARGLVRVELVGGVITLAGVAALSVARLGVLGPLVGLGIAALVVGITRPLRRVATDAAERGWVAFVGAASAARTLLEAAAELRAHGVEGQYAERLEDRARDAAHAERTASRAAIFHAMLPAGLAVAAALLPAAWLAQVARLDATILALAAASVALGLAQSLEAWRRSAPFRRVLERLEGEAASTPRPPELEAGAGEKLGGLRVEGLCVRHPGSSRDTPHALSFSLERGGLALTGDNGAGKSTAIVAILGLVTPTSGAIAGVPAPPDPTRVAYLPQRPHVDPGASVRHHLELFGTTERTLERLETAITRVGLAPLLRARGGGDLARGLEAKMGSLSGGERQRVGLARLLAADAPLVILDEPEAGLDGDARALLRGILEELASDRVVLLVAHDPEVIPASFRRVACVADAGS